MLAGFSMLAQATSETFGKNRIQYRTFDWQYISGENFDVYFYGSRLSVARESLDFLEGEFDRITDQIGYPPYYKTKIFLYNSLTDLRQSNIGLNRTIFTVGGETEFVKPYVEAAHLGNIQDLKGELLYRISDLMVNEMMFGGTLKDVFQSALLMNLPDWFVDGVSLYVAKGWDTEMDDYIRQYMRSKKTRKLGKLNHKEAGLVGQSVWNYIAEKYGRSSVANILNYTRVTRNEESGIQLTLGVSYKQLVADWERYYSEMEVMVSKSYVAPSDSTRFTFYNNKTTQFTTVKMSPDGRYIAYAENDRGRFIVKVRELGTEKEKVILSGGSKVVNQRVDYNVPLINWADDHTLGVIGTKYGEYVFWLYDLSTKTKLPRELDRFSNIRSFDFSGNGRLVIVSADFEGQNDLFLVSSRRDRVRRLTNDIYDDLDPSFVPGTNSIVFSSNRTSDTLQAGKKVSIDKLTNNYNLFSFDLDTTKTLLSRLTNTLSKDYAPMPIDNHTFIYLSDQRGIVNLFKYDLNSGIYSQITNYSSGIKEYDYNVATKRLAIVTNKNLKENIYIQSNFDVNRQIFTPATRRKELQQARSLRDRRKQEETNKNMSIKDLLNERLKESQKTDQDSTVTEQKEVVQPDSVQVPVENPITIEEKLKPLDKTVNTDNYQFEDEADKETQTSEVFLSRFMKAHEKSRITGPFPYEPKFGYDNLITSLIVDPMRGLGIKIETQMNDMLENYRFFGGIMTSIDLKNGDVFGEIQYLPGYIDFSTRFDRKSIYRKPDADGDIYKYILHKAEFGASLPISDRTRVTLKPFFEITSSVNLGPNRDFSGNPPQEDLLNNYYGGMRAEIVYDNSIVSGMNMIEGTRAKMSFVHHQGLNNANNSFSQVSVDVRHYQKIYKEIVFAVRGFAGGFYGRSPKQYLLGGMDNWFFNSSRTEGTTSEGQPNPLGIYSQNQDLLFVEYATNLRGFDYATLFGNSVVLMNAELRLPLARALAGGPISSNFFRNMQFTAFYDIGSSWSGKPPFNSENSVSYKIIRNGPFEAQLKNYLNPWLYSYGVGFRSVMLGYYIKADLAWPVENYKVRDPRLFVTLGFDF